jgi:hypothetical protein
MRNRRYPWLRPIIPCTILGATLGLLLPNPLNTNDAKMIGDILVGAVFGFLVGIVLDGFGSEPSPERLVPRRFSLRTLLISITVLALLLGLIIAATR